MLIFHVLISFIIILFIEKFAPNIIVELIINKYVILITSSIALMIILISWFMAEGYKLKEDQNYII